MSNVIQFQPRQPQPPHTDPLYYVTIFPNATHFRDPNRDEPDRRAATDALFDSTFHVCQDTDDCVMLVMIGAERSDSLRAEHSFETPAQRAWLRRRLDTLYEQVTGERPGIFRRLGAFFRKFLR